MHEGVFPAMFALSYLAGTQEIQSQLRWLRVHHLICPEVEESTISQTTPVCMCTSVSVLIVQYMSLFNWNICVCVCVCFRDKAGGYGIQALGGMLVEYVHGDFLNVVGFPLNHFCKQLDLIYNSCTFSSNQESLFVPQSLDSTHTTLILTQPAPNLPAQSSHGQSSSAKCNLSSNPRQNSPSASPVHTVSFSYHISTIKPFVIVYK